MQIRLSFRWRLGIYKELLISVIYAKKYVETLHLQRQEGLSMSSTCQEVEIDIFFPIFTLNNAVKSNIHISLFLVAKDKTDLLPMVLFFPSWYDLSCTFYLNCCLPLILI